MRGIDPRTSRMQSERSTISDTSPVRKRGANDIWKLSSVNAMVDRSLLLHIVVKLALSMLAINQSMCFSYANRLPFRLTCLAGGVQRGCLCQRDVFDSLISRVIISSTSFCGNFGVSGHQSLSVQALYCFRCLLLHIGRTNPCLLLV